MDKKTSFAVALQYDEDEGAPKVTAQGSGEIAEKILELANEHGIPLYEDATLVKLLSDIDIGNQIPEELFTVVAEVIAFAYSVNDEKAL